MKYTDVVKDAIRLNRSEPSLVRYNHQLMVEHDASYRERFRKKAKLPG